MASLFEEDFVLLPLFSTYEESTMLAPSQVFFWACSDGHQQLVANYIKEDKELVNSRDLLGRSPLQLASANNQLATIQFLVDNGADVNFLDLNGDGILSWTSDNDCKTYLQEKNAQNITNSDASMSDLTKLARKGDLGPFNVAEINKQDERGITPLIQAVASKQYGSFVSLMSVGVDAIDVNARDKYGTTPLMYCARIGIVEFAETLLKNSADIDAVDGSGNTALAYAAAVPENNAKMLKFLLDNGAEIDRVASNGKTPLTWACFSAIEDNFDCLLNNGADINVIDNEGNTPLAYSVLTSYKLCEKILQLENVNTNLFGDGGKAPLSWAVINNSELSAIEMLIRRGGDVNVIDNSKKSPATYAIEYNNFAVLKYLIEAQLINSCKPGDDGNAFISAVQASNFETFKFLMDNLVKCVSNLVFPYSVTEQNLTIFDYLLKNGVDIHRINSDGSTALTKSVCENNIKLVEHLIAAGSDVNLQDNCGIIPILKAVENNNMKIVQALIEQKAQVNVVDSNGYSPLRNALELNLMLIFKYLIASGANVNEVIGENDSLLKIAFKLKNYKAFADLLVAKATVNESDDENMVKLSKAMIELHEGVSLCHICCTKEINCALHPCGHLTMCKDCATSTYNSNASCPMCRRGISSLLQVYR